ncbi:MAG: rod shape-determining protein RodA [Candidatus Omnitrophota bacterium]|nr:MAG: rod shape-determining protein RodA [Candidatus Omnitrophota bacterium]
MTTLQARFRLTPSATLIICIIFLNALSLISLYSSLHQGGKFEQYSVFYRQVVWIALAWIFLIIFSFINYRLYYDLSFIIYGLNIILLLWVLVFGKEAMGAQRWIRFLGFNFQPSELSKITTILILARFFASERIRRSFRKDVLLPLGLVVFNALLIFKQPDLGTALILFVLFFLMGIFSRLPKKYFILLLIAGLALAPIGWKFLKDYQKKRLIVFIDPNVDPLGAGYTIIQSKIAIGSGEIFGKGFLSGTQNQFNFLPERHTDFIFTVIAEEWGFMGSLFLLFIYWLILKKILDLAKDSHDRFARQVLIGMSALFFAHIFINIGMTLGILPVVGLPLIFLSYGGSNLLINFILAGIIINIARST